MTPNVAIQQLTFRRAGDETLHTIQRQEPLPGSPYNSDDRDGDTMLRLTLHADYFVFQGTMRTAVNPLL